MKTPQKLLAVLGIALAIASSQANLADAPSILSGALHEPAPAPVHALRRQPWNAGDPGIFLPEPNSPPSYAWTDGATPAHQLTLMAQDGNAGFAPQWQQLIGSLDADNSWRLALSDMNASAAHDWVDPDPVPVASVPEPAGYLALLAGLAGMALLRRVQMKSITGE